MNYPYLFFAIPLLFGISLATAITGCNTADDTKQDSDAPTDKDADGGEDTASDTEASDTTQDMVEEQVDDILSDLDLEQKIGQMVQGQFEDATTGTIRDTCMGSVFSGGEEPVDPNNPENWAEAIDIMQQAALDGCGIPILYGIDAVHGNGKVVGSTVFPHNIGFGAAGDADLVERVGRATARECRGSGIHMTFAPAVSVVRDERWGRTYEGFGETPEINAELGAAYIRGLQGMGDLSDPGAVAATAKHYVGDGGTVGGINNGVDSFSDDTMRAVHLPPYEAAVETHVAAIMPSYHRWERSGELYPMTTDSYTLTDILKGELGFDGFLLSDYDAVPRAAGLVDWNYTEDNVAAAVNAGLDMAMIAADGGILKFINAVYSGVEDGTINPERVDDAVRRILRIKVKMKLFENPFSNPALRAEIWSEEHQALAREAVQKSLVLLKNDNNALPLTTSDAVTAAGPYADQMGAQAGGWTVGWQGMATYDTEDVMGETIRTGFEQVGGENVTWDETADNLDGADKVVVVLGEKPYAEGQGDHGSMGNSVYLSDCPDYEVLTAALESDAQVILVILSGRPMILDNNVLDGCDAIVAAWLPGSRGIGVADVLYGKADFTGKLPHTWPASFDQIPVNVDKQDDEPGNDASEITPLYPLGHGLSLGSAR